MTEEGKLSRRLTGISDLVRIGRRPADIGCDHAYVPIRLCERNQIDGAVAADVRSAPLAIAAENIRRHGLEGRIVIRQSDGFSNIRAGEIDSALITGMGGMLICRILKEGSGILPTLRELIVEPQSDVDRVRYLITEGVGGAKFRIDEEALIFERGKYYPIIHAVPSDGENPPREAENGEDGSLSRPELLYGPVLLSRRDPVLRQYLENRHRKLRAIEESLMRIHSPGTMRIARRIEEIREEIACCVAALKYYEMQ